jgi:hypothetical protein
VRRLRVRLTSALPNQEVPWQASSVEERSGAVNGPYLQSVWLNEQVGRRKVWPDSSKLGEA